MRGLTIKETRKTRGGLISGEGLITGLFFCLLVDGPITGGDLKAAVYGMSIRICSTCVQLPGHAMETANWSGGLLRVLFNYFFIITHNYQFFAK